jgi:hypothetical protein
MPGEHSFILRCMFEPIIVNDVSSAGIDCLQVGVKIALADLAAIILGLRIDTAG